MWIVTTCTTDIRAASASAVPFLVLFGVVAGGWQMACAALAAQEKIVAGEGDPFFTAKIVTARFIADHLLAQADGLASTVADGVTGQPVLSDCAGCFVASSVLYVFSLLSNRLQSLECSLGF